MDEREWEFANADKCVDCGTELPIQVCQSAAGYYIGKECPNDGPYSRLSNYMATRDEADGRLIEWLDTLSTGGDLRYAHGVRVIGHQPGPIYRLRREEW